MTKSELRAMIRECLQEELSKMSLNEGIIKESDFLSTIPRTLTEYLGGTGFEVDLDSYTVSKNFNDITMIPKRETKDSGGRVYSFLLIQDVPNEAEPTKEFLDGMEKCKTFFSKLSSKRNDADIQCNFTQTKSGSTKNIFCKITLVPASGNEIVAQ